MRVLLYFVVGAVSVCARDWTPKRIVAITDYVPLARQARIFGDVEVKCFLDANGLVLRAEVVSGHPLLKEQARQNALLWKFLRIAAQSSNTVNLKYLYRLGGEPQDRGHTVFVVDLPNTIQIVAPEALLNP
ncbi:MAG: energy transducer TonB [Bryobacteraceae bacterium]